MYLRVNINDKNNIYYEIEVRINTTNWTYFAMNKMLSYKVLRCQDEILKRKNIEYFIHAQLSCIKEKLVSQTMETKKK